MREGLLWLLVDKRSTIVSLTFIFIYCFAVAQLLGVHSYSLRKLSFLVFDAAKLVLFRETRKKSGNKCKERTVQTWQGCRPGLEISATYLLNSRENLRVWTVLSQSVVGGDVKFARPFPSKSPGAFRPEIGLACLEER